MWLLRSFILILLNSLPLRSLIISHCIVTNVTDLSLEFLVVGRISNICLHSIFAQTSHTTTNEKHSKKFEELIIREILDPSGTIAPFGT